MRRHHRAAHGGLRGAVNEVREMQQRCGVAVKDVDDADIDVFFRPAAEFINAALVCDACDTLCECSKPTLAWADRSLTQLKTL